MAITVLSVQVDTDGGGNATGVRVGFRADDGSVHETDYSITPPLFNGQPDWDGSLSGNGPTPRWTDTTSAAQNLMSAAASRVSQGT